TTGWRGNELPVQEAASHWSPFYVHPRTGALCEAALGPGIRRRDEEAERRAVTQRRLSESRLLRQVAGIWFECAVEPFPAYLGPGDEPPQFDLAERRLIEPGHAKIIDGKEVFCIAMRQISRRELRKF